MTTDVEGGGPRPEKKPVEEVAFLNGKNDQIEIRDKAPKSTPKFIGLNKEELSAFADDPFWVRTRRVLFVGFWIVWLAMIVAAATIIAISPRCPPRPPQKWWDAGVVYRVFVRSFKDSNNDGKGDLPGLTSNMKYVKSLGANALSLSSFLQTASVNESAIGDLQAISAVDVIDFRQVDSTVGTAEDVSNLIKEARKIGLKILLEMDPNLSSNKHPLFLESAAKKEGRKDFYVWWNNSTDSSNAPTLWSGRDGKQVWHFDETRQAWYYARNGPKFPELNYASEDVKTEVKRTFSHWLEQGIDGFIVHSAAYLYEDKDSGYSMQKKSIDFIAELRKVLDDYTLESGKEVVLVVDGRDVTGDQDIQNTFYHDGVNPGAHIVLNNAFVDGLDCEESESLNGKCVTDLAIDCAKNMERAAEKLGVEVQRLWPNWLSSNAAKGRLGDRLASPGMKDALNLMMLTMDGAAFVWYGDEIGMSGHPFAPMQWDDSSNAGFASSAEPWLPVGEDAGRVNVKFERAVGNDESVLKTFLNMTALRSEAAFLYGQMTVIDGGKDLLFSFVREAMGHPPYYVAINFGHADTTIPVGLPSHCSKTAKVRATTANAHPDISVGKSIDLGEEDILLKPGQGVVLKLG